VNKSLDFKRIGPFKITEVLPNDNFRLELSTEMKGMHDVFHVNLLEKYYENTLAGRETLPPPPVSVLVGEEIVDEYETEEFARTGVDKPKKMNVGLILMGVGALFLTWGAVNFFKDD
jgi:hypothetical protein